MKRKYLYIFFALFLVLIFKDNVYAKDVKQVCQYVYQNDIRADGSTTAAGTAYQEATITITIYDDDSHDGTSSSLLAIVGGNEKIKNWGESANGVPDIKSGNCPTYIGVSIGGISGMDRIWYGFTSETLSTYGPSVVNRDSMPIYKWDGADTPSYTCEYEGAGYTIKVNTDTHSVEVLAVESAYSGVYYFLSEDFRGLWFSDDRGTEKCLKTVACRSSESSSTYYIFHDSMAAKTAGYPYCENKECSGDDCDETVNSSCLTYNTYKNGIDSLYEQIENGDGDEKALYTEVHEKEKYLLSLCHSVFKTATYSDSCVQACIGYEEDLSTIKENHGINTINTDTNSCNISKRLAAWLIRTISWIRYIAPVIIIILTILDFIKAIAADNEDEIKKVSGKFAKRLIVALILFLLPLLIEFLLGIFNQDTYQYCLK